MSRFEARLARVASRSPLMRLGELVEFGTPVFLVVVLLMLPFFPMPLLVSIEKSEPIWLLLLLLLTGVGTMGVVLKRLCGCSTSPKASKPNFQIEDVVMKNRGGKVFTILGRGKMCVCVCLFDVHVFCEMRKSK